MLRADFVDTLPEDEIPFGRYVARSGSQAYQVLNAMVVAGEAKLLGERREDDGTSVIAVQVGKAGVADEGSLVSAGMNRNPQIGIGAQFFSTALKTYRGWKEAWWREAIQNSVDAGATRIECECVSIDGGSVRVSVIDNGGGMDEDVLLNKFLVLGGTTKKTGSGSTGGFGKAKELLILPWLGWEIQSRDLIVTGQNISYEVSKGSDIGGTRLTVIMPGDDSTEISCAIAFVSKCFLPGVSFTFRNSDGVVSVSKDSSPNLAPGDVIKEVAGKAEICFAKGFEKSQRFENRMLIRAKSADGRGSLFMWDEYLPDDVKGQLICEITGPTIELLNDNRQSWRDWELENAVSKFRNQLAVDVKSALRGKEKIERVKYQGTGKFAAEDKRAQQRAAAALTECIDTDYSGKPVEISAKNQAQALRILESLLGRFASGGSDSLVLMSSIDTAGAMLSAIGVAGPSQVEAIARQLVWQPDFYLYSVIPGYTIPKKFKPEGMSDAMRKLAKMWAETCRMVLANLGCTKEYGIGFVFDNGADSYGGAQAASCLTDEEDETWLLLNPFKDGASMSELLSVTSKDDLDLLLALAIHECTHMADGISYHNESFASAFTMNVAKCARLREGMPKLKRAIYSEVKAGKEPKEKRSAKPREELGGEIDDVGFAPDLSGSEVKLWDADKWEGVTGVAIMTPKGLYYEFFAQSPARNGRGTFVRISDRQASLVLEQEYPGKYSEQDSWGKLRKLIRETFARNYPGDIAGVTYATMQSWGDVLDRWRPYDTSGMISDTPFGT